MRVYHRLVLTALADEIIVYLFKDLKTRSGEIAAEGQIAEAMKDKDMWNELEKSGTVSIDDLLNDTIGIDTSMDFDTTAN